MNNSDANLLSKEELAITLELGNITSGAASATLAMLIDQDLEMGQPEVIEFASIDDFIASGITQHSVMAVLRLMNGFQIPMAYLLETQSAIQLANIMMGGTASSNSGEITDIELSAVGEAISQMMGAAANSISQFLSHPVDISAPEVVVFDPKKLLDMIPETATNPLVMVKYRLTGSKIFPACDLLQITPMQSLRHQINYVRTAMPVDPSEILQPTQAARNEMMMDDSAQSAFPPPNEVELAGVSWGAPSGSISPIAEPEMASFAAGGGQTTTAAYTGQGGGQSNRQTPNNPVTVQPVEFPSFDNHVSTYGGLNKNLELVMDVCLNLTVELGRTELPIKEVLELTRGSVIELNRVAGESVDLFANGKMIAKGEVVVIEDNFGLRITSIVSPADRLRGL